MFEIFVNFWMNINVQLVTKKNDVKNLIREKQNKLNTLEGDKLKYAENSSESNKIRRTATGDS